MSPLQVAAGNNSLHIIDALISAGADVNAKDNVRTVQLADELTYLF